MTALSATTVIAVGSAALVAAITLFGWSLCRAAARADEMRARWRKECDWL